MNQLKFNEIISSILHAKNRHEEEANPPIKTNNVKLFDRRDDLAFFVAEKSDNSKTLFFAIQPKKEIDHWIWICPNKEHIIVLTSKLQEFIGKSNIEQGLEIGIESEFSNTTALINEVRGRLGDTYKVESIIHGVTVMIIAASKSKTLVFIAIKPSRQYGHWYLLYPSITQINMLIKDLGEVYSITDATNDKTRWNNI